LVAEGFASMAIDTVFEDPLPILFVGVLAEALLILAFFHLRKWEILLGVFGIAALVGVLLLVETLVVTDRERVAAQLDAGVVAFLHGDKEGVLNLIAPEATATRARAEQVLRFVKFHWIKLRNLEIVVNRLTSPPTAEARFHAAFHFEDRSGHYPYRYEEVGLVVEFVLTDQGWLVTDHIEYFDVR
jgi:hypothetical protein